MRPHGRERGVLDKAIDREVNVQAVICLVPLGNPQVREPLSDDVVAKTLEHMPRVSSKPALVMQSVAPIRRGHWSRQVFDRAVRESSWRVSATSGPCPWMERAEIEEARRNLPGSAFARLFLNEWAQGEDRLFDPVDVAACVCHSGPLPREARYRYRIGVDLALRNDRAAVCVGHLDRDLLVVDRLDVWTPRGRDVDLSQVESLIAARSREYGRAEAWFDPAMAAQMIQRLRAAGVTCREHTFTAASNSRRTLLLLQLVREHRLRLPDDPELVDELVNLRAREPSPGVYRTDHDSNKHDDRVTALSLVALLCERVVGPASIGRASNRPIERPKPSARSLPRRTATMLTFADGTTAPVVAGSVQERILRRQGFSGPGSDW